MSRAQKLPTRGVFFEKARQAPLVLTKTVPVRLLPNWHHLAGSPAANLAIGQMRILNLISGNHKHGKQLESNPTNRRASCY
jgi:hypothetical protein